MPVAKNCIACGADNAQIHVVTGADHRVGQYTGQSFCSTLCVGKYADDWKGDEHDVMLLDNLEDIPTA